MGIFSAYSEVMEPAQTSRFGYPAQETMSWSGIYSVLNYGDIRDFRVPVSGGEVRASGRAPVFEVDWSMPEESAPHLSIQLAHRARVHADDDTYHSLQKTDLWVARTLPNQLVRYEAVFNQPTSAFRIRLPPDVVARATGNRAGSFVYGRAGREQREKLYDTVLLPIVKDVRRLHLAGRINRFNEQCMTTVCFEPRVFTEDGLADFLTDLMGEDAGVHYRFTSIQNRHQDYASEARWSLSVRPGRNLSASYVGNSGISPLFDLLADSGMHVPQDAVASYGEHYITALGQKFDAAMDWCGKQWTRGRKAVGRSRPVAAFNAKMTAWREASLRGAESEREHIRSWLEQYAPRPNEKLTDGCIILVDPVCELKAKRGEPPLVQPEPSLSGNGNTGTVDDTKTVA